MIAISEGVFAGLLFLIIGLFFALLMLVVMIKTQAPEAFLFLRARRGKKPIAFVHYPEGTVRPYIPRKVEKGDNAASNYFYVGDVGIKFTDPDGKRTERWNGEIPIYNYFSNSPESVAVTDAVAFSQINDYLKKKGIDITNIEDLAFYILTEVERTGNIEQSLRNAQISDEETMSKIMQFLDFVHEHKEEIESLRLTSGIFTYQTVIQALDATLAYTSSNVAHMKSVLEASIRRMLGSEIKDYIKYGIMMFLAALGVGAIAILIRSG